MRFLQCFNFCSRCPLSGISKPMRVAFHENDRNHENDENDEDNSDSYKQGVECWIRGSHGNHENDENHGNPVCKPRVPQTTGLEIPDFRFFQCSGRYSLAHSLRMGAGAEINLLFTISPLAVKEGHQSLEGGCSLQPLFVAKVCGFVYLKGSRMQRFPQLGRCERVLRFMGREVQGR